MATLYSYFYALALLGSLTTPVNCLAYDKHVSLFVFGDSLFDPGNNNYINTTTNFQANFPPYGQSYFKHPTGRFSDGRLIPDFIAEFAKLPLISPYLRTDDHGFINGVNFASAGAGSLVETFSFFVIDLKTQVGYFKKVATQLKEKLGEKESKTLISNAVYMFSIGNNDYSVPVFTNSTILNSYTRQEYVEMVIGNLTSVIEDIYKKGGRKFVIFSVAPLGCGPSARALNLQQTNSSGCLKEFQDLAKMHNKALFIKLSKLVKTLQGFKYSYFDFFTVLINAIDNPLKYGFKETRTACCGSGPFRGLNSCGGKRGELHEYELCKNVEDYLFFDGHPTEKSNFMSATLVWNGAPNLVQPYNFYIFNKLGDKESKTVISNAVYMFSIGNNDYTVPFYTNSTILSSYSRQEYVEMVIGNLTSVTKDIYKEGGRKFVINSVGPLGCVPFSRALNLQQTNSSGCLKGLQDLAKMHNKALPKKLRELEKTLQEFKYSYFDFFTFASDAIDNPLKYGFKETRTACCGSGPFRGLNSCGGKRGELHEYELCKDVGDYLFFDTVHPTEKSNFMSATLLWNGDPNLVQPYNVKSFFEFV